MMGLILKKAMCLAAMGVWMTCAAAAPEKTSPKTEVAATRAANTVDKVLAAMKTELALTEEQQKQLRPIVDQHLANLQALRAKYTGRSPREFRKARKEWAALREAHEQRLARVLSEEQMNKYEEMLNALRQEFREAVQQKKASIPTKDERINHDEKDPKAKQ